MVLIAYNKLTNLYRKLYDITIFHQILLLWRKL